MKEEKKYSPKEEFANAFTHAIGALLSIYGIVMLAVNSKTPMQTASTAIFGAMMLVLFQASVCYHSMINDTAKNVFQRIDHSAIYLMIAGTYTPILLLAVPFPYSVAIMAMVWYIAIHGIVFSCMTLKFKGLSTGLYLLLGWLSVSLIWFLWKAGSIQAVIYLLGGGVIYSIGCVFYLSKRKYSHAIWHLFVLGGAIMHYLCIMELLK